MKRISRLQVTAWVLSLLPAAMTAAFYSRLPAEIPMQWDLVGHVSYETRWHLWIVVGMAPLFAVLFYFLPRFDPKSKNYDKFSDAYVGFQIMIDLFLTAMCGICIAEALRPGTVDVPTVVCLLVSLLVMCLGNIMPKFRMNWYCGLKTPWTLSSETVWLKTHRVAGRMLFCGGYYRCGRLISFKRNCKVCAGACANGGGNDYPDCAGWRWYRAERSNRRKMNFESAVCWKTAFSL